MKVKQLIGISVLLYILFTIVEYISYPIDDYLDSLKRIFEVPNSSVFFYFYTLLVQIMAMALGILLFKKNQKAEKNFLKPEKILYPKQFFKNWYTFLKILLCFQLFSSIFISNYRFFIERKIMDTFLNISSLLDDGISSLFQLPPHFSLLNNFISNITCGTGIMAVLLFLEIYFFCELHNLQKALNQKSPKQAIETTVS